MTIRLIHGILFKLSVRKLYAPVAQLDRVSDSDSEGHAFESHRAYQKKKPLLFRGFFIFRTNGIFSFHVLTIKGKLGKILLVRGCSSMAELQLPKLTTWVRFPSPAPLVCPHLRGHRGFPAGCRLSQVRPAVSPASLRNWKRRRFPWQRRNLSAISRT